MGSIIDPAHLRSASLLKVVQSMTATVGDLPTTTRRDMVAYARAIRSMVEVGEITMARALLGDLLKAVQDSPSCSGWEPIIARRVTDIEKVL